MVQARATQARSLRALARWSALATLAMLLAGLSFAEGALAQAFESRAPRAFLYDVNSRTVLYTQLADEAFEPASIAKTLTAAVVFEAISNGSVSLDTPLTISEDAWRDRKSVV